MNDDLLKINQQLGNELKLLANRLHIAIVGLEAIISNNCDTLKIAEKTLEEVENLKQPQDTPPSK
ncbi:MAG: hypothetical protein CBC27_00935 [Opitutia bacterium TMED67]|nr:MAG: hypothetical protein CBC27_00935 [Opitutae bacterium TMED67]|tara:strand:+ start:325 stop:519 length:195 start_codon:yes stop_codon:yes gene_type:complete